MNKEEIEGMLKEYLNCEKVIRGKDGLGPYETNGHIDDVACFVAPGEVACIYTEDEKHPFYKEVQAAYNFLCGQTDARGCNFYIESPVNLCYDFPKCCNPSIRKIRAAALLCRVTSATFCLSENVSNPRWFYGVTY